jgi:signal transduction histidine kinase
VSDLSSQKQAETKAELRVLLVDDQLADAHLIELELTRAGVLFSANIVQFPDEFRQQLRDRQPDIILCDYNLHGWGGMDALEVLREMGLDIPFILVTGSLGEVAAVECIKAGVTDYVLKGSLARLPIAITRALREQELKTQKKKTETELARSNRDLQQFASVASHDLQEPLRMVAAYTELLSKRYKKGDDQTDKYIHYIVDGSTRMQSLIRDLLGFARIGGAATELTAADCNPLLEAALLNLAASIQESGARIVREQLPIVMGNGPQLQQVFQNLIGNAIKFRGAVPPVIKISAELRNKEWIFAVSDNGIGIAPENAKTIFAVFQRLHTRKEYAGNGIGLAICKRVIERQGGTIWMESPAQGGTTFKFTLRAKPRSARDPAAPAEYEVGRGGNCSLLRGVPSAPR